MKPLTRQLLLTRIKIYIWIIIAGLFISGITAFPLETELLIFISTSAFSLQ
ncbi:hypothetical protein ACFQ3S_03180 [Mucilaginibacter terrae]|uniref:hypothetical protein n=1 Tax=Mucilaginibacter terrae TaxID=1955052 RepID=UPI0036371EC0